MPLHDWTRVRSGIDTTSMFYGCPRSPINSIVGGPEPDVVALEMDEFEFPGGDGSVSLMADAPPQPQTSFVIAAETERYASKANRVAIRHSLGKLLAVIKLVSPGNKGSQYAMRSFVQKTVGLRYDDVNALIIDPFPPSDRDPQGIHPAIWDEIMEATFVLPPLRNRTRVSYQTLPVKTAYVEPVAVGSPLPDMPLFLHGDFYVNVPLEAT